MLLTMGPCILAAAFTTISSAAIMLFTIPTPPTAHKKGIAAPIANAIMGLGPFIFPSYVCLLFFVIGILGYIVVCVVMYRLVHIDWSEDKKRGVV